MRVGPPRGATATLEVTVTPDMAASVAGEQVHAVYGTVALVGHMEQVARLLLVPHLEAGEEGVGAALDVMHRAPVPIGETVVLTATVATVTTSQLVCEVLVRHGATIVARGSVAQRVVELAAFHAEVADRRTRPETPARSG